MIQKTICRAVIFDMDGTVLNTIDDLAYSLNYALAETGHRHNFTADEVKCFFGSGIRVAIRRALAYEAGLPAELLDRIGTEAEDALYACPPRGISASSAGQPQSGGFAGLRKTPGQTKCEDFSGALRQPGQEVQRILGYYQPHYETHCGDHTAPYPGIPELLTTLRAHGLRTAVVSNKPDPAVQILAENLFDGMFDFVIGEQEGIARKPAPDMVLAAIRSFGLRPEEALYVGDSEIDIRTARNNRLSES